MQQQTNTPIKRFSDLNISISSEDQVFTGKKIDIDDILNEEIIIHDYKVKQSKYADNAYDKCLWLQISVEGRKHVVFKGSRNLILHMEQVPKTELPISTKIVKKDKAYFLT